MRDAAGSQRVVAIAGATGAAGRAATAAFAVTGARLGLIGTSAARLRALAADLALPDGSWAPAVADVGTAGGARKAADAVTAALGRVDVLLYLVGGWSGGAPATAVDPTDFDQMLRRHLYGTLHMVQAVVPGMVERGWGRIMAISTPVASEPGPHGGGYVAAKAAQEALLRTLARDVAGTGVTANLLLVRTIAATHERDSGSSHKAAQSTTPEEIAQAMVMLASDAAATINGARIPLYSR